ncbi:hypothetical protein Y032_0118g748 [Ancylostoma ceylanicum]|uniref:Uncharacterized protein n=1 Tax=Ancylostoma ceylanicum TaxID=53326 RepID=A0A016TBL6_9BILA|nr:hypothetical protein Y032_0118g748 [Ancylostoma ceylanicum]
MATSPTNADHSTGSKVDNSTQPTSDAQYSFFWDENLPDKCCMSEFRMELQPTLPIRSVQTLVYEDEHAETLGYPVAKETKQIDNEQCCNPSIATQTEEEPTDEKRRIHSDAMPGTSGTSGTSTSADDVTTAYESDDIYKPTVTPAPYKIFHDAIMQRRMQRRQIRRAEQFLRNSVLSARDNQVYDEFATPARQSTQYCDIDANDDATLWMLLQLSAKKLRGQTWPCRNRDDLRELILINRVAEKAFSHLFPPIKP